MIERISLYKSSWDRSYKVIVEREFGDETQEVTSRDMTKKETLKKMRSLLVEFEEE